MLTLSFLIAFVFCIAIAIATILIGHELITTYRNSFLRNYFYYLIAFYAFAFYGIWAQLVVRWSLAFINVESGKVVMLANFLPALGIPFLVVSWIMLIKVAYTITEPRPRLNEIMVHSIVLLVTGLSSIAFYSVFRNASWLADENIVIVEAGSLLALEALYIVSFAALVLRLKQETGAADQNILTQFTLILVVGLGLRLAIFPLVVYQPVLLAPAILIYFLSNLFPVIYLKYNADQVLQPIGMDQPNNDNLDIIIKKYRVTKREQEIISQICLGKTNQQIADELFISLQTVKDHNHRIFTKLGINNRLMLVKMVGAN